MSQFSDPSYDSKNYRDIRPTYPKSLYDYIREYYIRHNSSDPIKGGTVVDVGCGPGFTTQALLQVFENVRGFDPSEVMIQQANADLSGNTISFSIGTEKTFVDAVPAHSLDAVTSAQAAHWFDPQTFMTNAHKTLKPGGVFAIWGYVDPYIIGHPKANQLVDQLMYGDKFMGPYWQEPGRSRLRDLLQVYDLPKDLFYDIETYKVSAADYEKDPKDNGVYQLTSTIPVSKLWALIRTASAYSAWTQREQDASSRAEEVFSQIKELEGWTDDSQIDIVSSSVLIIATAK